MNRRYRYLLNSKFTQFILVLILFYFQYSQCNNPWLNLCLKDGSKYYIFEPNECEEGVYFQKPIEPTCVCGRGVWMFKKNICDPRGKPGYLIAATDERSCFRWKSGNPIKYLRYIGDPYNWKSQAAFITDDDFSRFEKIGGVGTSTKAGYSNIMFINPEDGKSEIRDCGNTWCYASDQGTIETKCTDCDISWTSSAGAAWKTVDNNTGYWYNTEETPELCEVPIDANGSTRKILHERRFNRIAWGAAYTASFYGDNISGRCTIPCDQPMNITYETLPPNHNGAVLIDKDGNYKQIVITSRTSSTTPKPNVTRIYAHLDSSNPNQVDPTLEYPPNCSDTTHTYNSLTPKQSNEIKEQTLRMLKLHYNVILNGQRSPDLKFPEYELFQTSRLIMEKVCPEQEVPHTLLRSLLRMFRMALNETQGSKYPYLMINDPDSISRLQKSLASCLNIDKTKQFHFQYRQCPREYMYTNITDIAVQAELPCELKFNTTKYDYVVEAAWKTFMFVHYYCAEYFDKEQYDHSRLQHLLQKFFNRNLMHRWFQPGKSNEVFEFMFSLYDLKGFKEGMDHCVAGARSISPYKKWLKRPIYENDCGGNMELDEGRKKSAPKSKIGKLGKHNLLFDGYALCLRNFDDMVSYNYAPAPCFPKLVDPKCYEFRDPSTIPKASITTTTTPSTAKPKPRPNGNGTWYYEYDECPVCVKIYAKPGHKGNLTNIKLSECVPDEPNYCCKELQEFDKKGMSIKNIECVFLYTEKSCQGLSKRFEPYKAEEEQEEHLHFGTYKNKFRSISICPPGSTTAQVESKNLLPHLGRQRIKCIAARPPEIKSLQPQAPA